MKVERGVEGGGNPQEKFELGKESWRCAWGCPEKFSQYSASPEKSTALKGKAEKSQREGLAAPLSRLLGVTKPEFSGLCSRDEIHGGQASLHQREKEKMKGCTGQGTNITAVVSKKRLHRTQRIQVVWGAKE